MNEIHALRVEGPSRENIEKVDPRFLKEKLVWARNKTWKIYEEIKGELREGLTEKDAFRLAMNICERNGVSKHWHKPFLRFGAGTVLTFHEPLLDSYQLKKDDAVYIDLGPVWADDETQLEYEGDVADSFAFGENPDVEACACAARDIFKEAETTWLNSKISGGELYELAKKSAINKGYQLIEKVDGHRVADFPHQKYSRERLSKLKFEPAPLLWVLEIHIRHPHLEIGAFFEDLLGLKE